MPEINPQPVVGRVESGKIIAKFMSKELSTTKFCIFFFHKGSFWCKMLLSFILNHKR